MRRGKLMATIALLGAVFAGILVGAAPDDTVLADGGGTTIKVNRGW